ncbi:MAG: nuclear transport factor 2 family protein [Oscillospiraceae bacterium]|nr:nuclear transport factor 2 family protein [Oscillospiraceae bacterium]
MNKRELLIQNCFHSWITKEADVFQDSFADEAVYIESWGPAYRNKEHIVSWFKDWTKENTVLEWNVISFIHSGNMCVCEWFFKCECGGVIDGFNGVSIVSFDGAEKITLLKEFQSKTPNVYPYG